MNGPAEGLGVMREFSKVSPNVWQSRKFWSLPGDEHRYLYLYILTNQHSNSAGCFQLPEGYGCADLKWSEQVFSNRMETISKAGLVLFDKEEKTLLITNWFEFNAPINAKHALGILDQIKQTSSQNLKAIAAQGLKAAVIRRGFNADKGLIKCIDIFLQQFANNIATETETKSEIEKEIETKTKIETERCEAAATPPPQVNGSASPTERVANEIPELPECLDRREKPASNVAHLLETPLMRRTGR